MGWKEIRRAERYFCRKNSVSRGREKFPTGNLFVTESLTLRFDKIIFFLINFCYYRYNKQSKIYYDNHLLWSGMF